MSKFELVITRTFDAPRELVFKAFTEPERLRQWWGPKGWTMTVSKQELRPDGILLYNARPADGHVMWVKFIYREISEPEKLVFTNSFSDEEGNTVRAPFNETWPLEVLNTLTFTEQDGKTTLTLRGFPLSATEEEHQTFEASQEMVQQGYGGTLDQLAEYLATT